MNEDHVSFEEDSSGDEVVLLRQRLHELQRDNERLAATVSQLKAEVAVTRPEPEGDFYTLDQFMLALVLKRGRTYGWRVDYATATERPGCQKVTTEDIQKWQKDKRVPAWAYTQINWMVFDPKTSRTKKLKLNWSEDNIQHLISLVVENPHERNAVLARKCSEHFGREITEQAIKGEKFRLEHTGRLPY